MPIKPEELLSYAGIDPEKYDSIDDAKTAFDTEFVKKSNIGNLLIKQPELADPIIGKRMSIIDRKIDSFAKAAGIEFDADSVKGKKVEDKMEIFQPLFEAKILELNSKAGAGNDEKLKALAEEKEKIESKYKDTFKLLNETKFEFEGYKNNIVQKDKDKKKSDYFIESLNSVEYSPEVDELKKKGFEILLKENYLIDLDENDAPFVKDAKTGERLKSSTKTGEFLDLKDIVKIEAEKNKVIKQSPYSGQKYPFSQSQHQQIPNGDNGGEKKKLNGR